MRTLLIAAAVTTAVVVGSAGVGLVLTGGPLADIRPSTVSLADDPAAETRGRALLETMAQAMGAPALVGHTTSELTVHDTWHGMFGMMAPWPAASQLVEVTTAIDSFDSHATFLDGPAKDTTWGIQAGRTWTDAGAVVAADDANIRFILPTVQYFFHLPHRIQEAPIVRHVGRQTLEGTDYDVVYATWGEVAANPDFDQYVLFIDPTSKRLAKVHFTVREAMRFATGAAHYDDLEDHGGYLVARRLAITGAPHEDPATDAMHTFVLKDFGFDTRSVRRPLP